MKFTKDQREEIKSNMGEGFHTAFRKAIDGHDSHIIWQKINDLPADVWGYAIDFVGDPIIEMVEEMIKKNLAGQKRKSKSLQGKYRANV